MAESVESDVLSFTIEDKWRILAQLIERGASEEDLSSSLEDLLYYSIESGISSKQIDWAIDLLYQLTSDGDDSNLCVKVLYLLIPNEPLTIRQIDSLLDWFDLSYQNNSIASMYFTFWLLVCLKAKIISKEHLQNVYYCNFFRMLLNNPRDDGLTLVLKKLVKPFHVSELDFTSLYNCYKSFPDLRKYLVVLIQRYAGMMPKTAKKLKINKLVQSNKLKITDKIMNKSFEIILTLHNTNTSLDEVLLCEDEPIVSSFFNMSSVYGRVSGVNITSLSSLEDLLKYYDSVNVPDNIVSILGNTCGQYYVALSSLKFTEQLEEQVSAILSGLLDNRLRSGLDYMSFLRALVRTQAACNQGMPCVSRFLSDFLIGWDGLKFKNAIIDLIPWFYFNSFRELEIFMKTLFNVYVSMPLKSKIQVIEALGDLYVNFMITYDVQMKTPIPFIGSRPVWILKNIGDISESLTLYIKSFVCMGLVTHGPETSFLFQVLILYYKIFMIEKKLMFSIFTVIPQAVVLLSQTSSCVSILSLLCKILTLYLKNKNEIASDDHQTLNLIIDYGRDTSNILLNGVEQNKLESLVLGRLLSERDAFDFGNVFNQIKYFMSVPKHFAFTAIVKKVAKKMKVDVKSIKPESYVDVLDHIAPDCASLVRESAKIMDIT